MFIIPLLVLLVFVLVFAFYLAPYVKFAYRGDLINREMHLFITRMGVLSTSDIARKEMLGVLAKMREYGELSIEVEKIFALVTRWNVSLEKACRTVASQTPSEMFSNFLLRLAHAVETGETAEEFFRNEQVVVMEQYKIKYESAMRNVDILKQVFIIVAVLFLFIFFMITLVPFLTGEDIQIYVVLVVAGMMIFEGIMVYLIWAIVPGERIWHNMEMKTKIHKEIDRKIKWGLIFCGLAFVFMLAVYNPMEYLFDVWIKSSVGYSAQKIFEKGVAPPQPTYYVLPLLILSVTFIPMLWAARFVNKNESMIKDKDKQYPPFIRSLGAAVGARSKSFLLPLKKLRLHDFGPLTQNIDDLYKRLATRIKTERAWEYFAAESLSELVSKFNEMYVEGTRMGGDTKAISRIISDNFIKMDALRELKYESTSTFTFMLYGLTMSMSFLLFFGLYLIKHFYDLLSQLWMPESAVGPEALDAMRALNWFKEDLVDFNFLVGMTTIMVVYHCGVSAMMTRVISGGNFVGASRDFVGLLWSATITAIAVMFSAQFLLVPPA
jgi:flagellar protein FlaJ